MNIYSIKDIKAELFGQPFFSRNDNSAVRSVEMFVNKPSDDPMVLHPEDFVVYRIGAWNDETGVIVSEVSPVSLVALSTLKKG